MNFEWKKLKRCEICSKLTIKTPGRCQWRRSGFFIVNFEHISHLVLVFCNFEHVNAGCVFCHKNAFNTVIQNTVMHCKSNDWFQYQMQHWVEMV